jgi:hypothetical protein
MLFCRIWLPDAPWPNTRTPAAFDAITFPAPAAPTDVFGAPSMLTPNPAFPTAAGPVAAVPTRLAWTMFPEALLPCVPTSVPPQNAALPQIAMPANPVLPDTTLPTSEFPGARLM